MAIPGGKNELIVEPVATQMTGLSGRRKRGSDLMRKWVIIFGAAFLLFLITMYGLARRIHAMVRNRTERILQTHFESKVEFSDFEISLVPRVHVTITGLVMRHKGRTDITPLIQVRELAMYANLLSLLRIKPRISFVQLPKLEYWDLPNLLEACTDGDAHCDACHLDAKRFGEFGKLDVNFAKDIVAGFVPLTSVIPSSLKKPGNTQHERAVI